MCQRAFEYWRGTGFPFPIVTDELIRDEVAKLRTYGSERLASTLRKPSTVGLTLANSFHPQIWEARVRGMSPVQVFNDDHKLLTVIRRAPRMRPNRRCWNAAHVRMLASLQNRSRVANFRPSVARVVAAQLSTDGDHVVDFCAGYGGRYLGVATLNRSYLGIDVSNRQVAGLMQMANQLTPHVQSYARFMQGPAEVIMKELEAASSQLVMTSPPYYRLEKYDDDERQCWRRYNAYDDWLESFLVVVIKEAFRVLRRGGFLAINIANQQKYPLAQDCATIMRKRFKNRVCKWMIHMSTNPHIKSKTGALTKVEPLLIVRK